MVTYSVILFVLYAELFVILYSGHLDGITPSGLRKVIGYCYRDMNKHQARNYFAAVVAFELVASSFAIMRCDQYRPLAYSRMSNIQPVDDLYCHFSTKRVSHSTYISMHIAVDRLSIVGTSCIAVPTLTVEEPKYHFKHLFAIDLGIDWDEVIGGSNQVRIAGHCTRSKRELIAILGVIRGSPDMLRHPAGVARGTPVVISERRSKRQLALQEWSHCLIEQTVRVLLSHPLTGRDVTVENSQVCGGLVIQNLVHDRDGEIVGPHTPWDSILHTEVT